MLRRGIGRRAIPLGDAACRAAGGDSWMRFINRSYRSVPPRSSDQRMFWTPELSQHAPAGVWAYAINPVASGGGFHFRYDGPIGVILSDEVRLLAVNLVRRNGAQALTGLSLIHI